MLHNNCWNKLRLALKKNCLLFTISLLKVLVSKYIIWFSWNFQRRSMAWIWVFIELECVREINLELYLIRLVTLYNCLLHHLLTGRLADVALYIHWLFVFLLNRWIGTYCPLLGLYIDQVGSGNNKMT